MELIIRRLPKVVPPIYPENIRYNATSSSIGSDANFDRLQSDERLWVTSIIVIAPPEPHSSAFEQECFDA
jgi:hypothetical protein